MNDEEMLALVTKHIDHWAPHIGLENYRFFVKAEPKLHKKNVMMEIQIDHAGYLRATILCNSRGPEERYVSLETDVIHELLHIPFDKLDDVAWAAGNNWQARYRIEEEGCIDFVAAVIFRLHKQSSCPSV